MIGRRLDLSHQITQPGQSHTTGPLSFSGDRIEILQLTDRMKMSHTGGHQQKLYILQASEGEGVDGSDGVVVDYQHGDVLRACEGVA